jgi:D-alanyl-D-alanine carboxypeptidase
MSDRHIISQTSCREVDTGRVPRSVQRHLHRSGLSSMSLKHASSWFRFPIIGLLVTLAIAAFSCDGAVEAHSAHRHPQAVHQAANNRLVHGRNYRPPYSAIVVDNNSGQVLHDENADEPRHPARA